MASQPTKLPSLPIPAPTPDKISGSQIKELSQAYPTVALRLRINWPKENFAKDEIRFQELPSVIAKRRGKPSPANSEWTNGWLEKEELQKLMDWKLHRGTWRPSLPGLIKSNDADKVIHDTAEALALLETSLKPATALAAFPKAALKAAARLKGVGPATASLILATAQPDAVPFMADELYAWFLGRKPEKYNEKELEALWNKVVALRKRLNGVSVQDVEKAVAVMAWARDGKVEGWEGGDDEVAENSRNEKKAEKAEKVKKNGKVEKVKKVNDKKRKAGDSEAMNNGAEKVKRQGTRKSARRTER